MTASNPTAIASVSFAYPQVDGTTRADLVRRLTMPAAGAPVFLLTTCLRTEVVSPVPVADLQTIVEGLFPSADGRGSGKVREGADAVEHLYRVAAGLESPILGEREILTQFRQAVAAAGDGDRLPGIFGKLIENAVAVARAAREVLPESPHDSMAAVAAQVVGSHERVAVLGSGAIATAVVRALQGLPAPPDVTVVARTGANVTVDGVHVWGFERAAEAIASFPAVISATSARRRPIEPAQVATALQHRADELTLIDMAMPPDFELGSDTSVRYIDIDDLARMADRRARGVEADELVRAAAAEAHRAYTEHNEVAPVIGALVENADAVVESVLARFGTKLTDDADVAVLRQAAHTVARTLLASPIAYLRRGDRAESATDVVVDAFGLDA